MSEPKTKCYYNNNPTFKLFSLYKDTPVETTGRLFFKVPQNLHVVGCLTPSSNGQYQNAISTIPQDYPQSFYFYSYQKSSQPQMSDVILVRVIDMSNDKKLYQFKMQKSDNIIDLNNKFKGARQQDKTPFVYLFNDQQLQHSTVLSQFPFDQIQIIAQPKLAYITVKDNKNIIHEVSVGLGVLKKNNARQLFERMMQNNEIKDNYKDHKIQYEYQNKIHEENQPLVVRAGDKVIIQLNRKIKPEQTALVNLQQSQEAIEQQPPQCLKSFIHIPAPDSSKLTFGKPDQRSIQNINQNQRAYQNPNINSNITHFNTQNNKTNGPMNYSLNSPVLPSKYQSQQFCDFKLQLQKLLSLVDSDQNDKSIKKLLSKFITTQLNK